MSPISYYKYTVKHNNHTFHTGFSLLIMCICKHLEVMPTIALSDGRCNLRSHLFHKAKQQTLTVTLYQYGIISSASCQASYSKALSTLSQKSETVAEKCDCRRKRRDNGDSLTFLRQCGQALRLLSLVKTQFSEVTNINIFNRVMGDNGVCNGGMFCIAHDTISANHAKTQQFIDSFIHFWHAPLWVRSAKCRHHSPEWTILSRVNCFVHADV